MYQLKKRAGYWLLADIARFIGKDPKVVISHFGDRYFPESEKFGERYYWKESEIRAFYTKKIKASR